MSITIENPEAEALLADLAAQTRRSPPDLLLALLQRERERLEREVADGIESGRILHERTHASPMVDPRPIDEILAYDEDGLPV
ncbi:type II toxin-antitoxin system VapB family antitoxin [Methylobacterium sp. NEAU 140]|uniref:type II toxin-antitoxin system VapB family antitoxin n=1 Tax=Methylobacterium sp. NEAU 140 TaxID=3064945 RepID=UPI0027348C9A|nr:type II toxin-antitoxin system VapB family antitoxin [Methylobacterium sp. NEAU 140]MDP4023924.1 type II toxin-antitoxin system VapB family antitoxin [Methylobacterium sp. NEAU 140]